jgi:PKD repeat protein
LALLAPLTDEISDSENSNCFWDFGDGSALFEPASAAPFTYTYLTTGTFTVILTTTNPGGSVSAAGLVTVTAQITPSLNEDFEGWAVGADPTFWLDQAADTSLQDNFEVLWSGDSRALGPTSTGSQRLYSTYAIPGVLVWQDYEYSGRVQLTDASGEAGLLVYSRYPAGEQKLYRLRSETGSGRFELSAVGTTLAGQTDTGVTVQADAWYRFRIQVKTGLDRVTLQARIWLDGQAEPSSWQAMVEDTSLDRITAGAVGLQTRGAGSKYLDDLVVTPLAEPVAGFSAFPTSGPAPLLVQFLNLSGNADSSLWHFGDGITSTLTSPTHT